MHMEYSTTTSARWLRRPQPTQTSISVMAVLLSEVVPSPNAKTIRNSYSYTARSVVKTGSTQNKHE